MATGRGHICSLCRNLCSSANSGTCYEGIFEQEGIVKLEEYGSLVLLFLVLRIDKSLFGTP